MKLSLVLLSAALLLVALMLPTVFFQALGSEKEIYSILGGVKSLWDDGGYVSAGLVFGFSVLFPCAKLIFLGQLCRREGASKGQRSFLRWLIVVGKWSRLDLFVIALFVASILPLGYADASSKGGIHLFTVAILLSMLAARWVGQRHSLSSHGDPVRPEKRFRWRGFLSASVLVLLGLALTETYYRIEKKILLVTVTDEISLFSSFKELWANDEKAFAIYLSLSVLVLPCARAFVALCFSFVPKRSLRRWAGNLEEWAMLDVFALGLVMVYDKLSELTDASLGMGFWYLLAAALVGELDSFLLRRDRIPQSETGA